jgi:aminoglycoside phosphotransferase (APT) family kinase protein
MMKNYLNSAHCLPQIIKALPFEVESWRLMNKGIWHDVYVLQGEDERRFVLKLPNKAIVEWEKKLRRERWVLKKLPSAAPKLSPDVVYLDASKKLVPFTYQIIDFLEGGNITKKSTDLSDLAVDLSKLHKLSFMKWGGLPPRKSSFAFSVYFTYRFSPQVVRLPSLAQKQLRPLFVQIKSALKAYPCRQIFSLTHGDVNTRNVLRSNNGDLVFIDWEMADIRPPASDLADLFVIERFSEKQKEDFLRVYGDSSKDMKQEIAIFEKLARFAELLDDLESGKGKNASIKDNVLDPLLHGNRG